MTLKRTIELLKEYLKMNNIELTNVNKYRLDQINKIGDYFNNEIKERKDIIKKSKTIEIFNFLHLMKSSLTIALNFSLLIISAIISSKIINTFLSLFSL